MSYLSQIQILSADSPSIDAFDRLRVSNPSSIFDSAFEYGDAAHAWDESTTGGGSVTHLPNESSFRLRCTTASGDVVIRQSRPYLRYQPGKSQMILITGVMGALKANVRQRIGLFEADNGLFFEQDGTNLKVVRRSYTSGASVDTAVNQSSWNLDTMDGIGPSGITLDMSKTQIFFVDFEWLGVGRVRMGFVIDGVIRYCHEFLNTNSLATVYMTTPHLPVRYEIENTAGTAGNTDLIQICSAVISEGGFDDERGLIHTASTGTTTLAITTQVPVMSLRPKATFGGKTNRGAWYPIELSVYAETNACYWELIYNGTLSGSPSWASVGTNSLVEMDTAASGISGGDVLLAGYVPAAAQNKGSVSSDIISRIPLTLDIAGANPIPLTLAATSMSGTTNVATAITVKELW